MKFHEIETIRKYKKDQKFLLIQYNPHLWRLFTLLIQQIKSKKTLISECRHSYVWIGDIYSNFVFFNTIFNLGNKKNQLVLSQTNTANDLGWICYFVKNSKTTNRKIHQCIVMQTKSGLTKFRSWTNSSDWFFDQIYH